MCAQAYMYGYIVLKDQVCVMIDSHMYSHIMHVISHALVLAARPQ